MSIASISNLLYNLVYDDHYKSCEGSIRYSVKIKEGGTTFVLEQTAKNYIQSQ